MITNTEAREGEGGATVATPGVAAQPRLQGMSGAIGPGSILIDDEARLPNSMLLQLQTHSPGWSVVTNDRPAFEKEVEKAGLTFFFMAGEIRATIFGFDRQKSMRRALSGLMATVKAQNCNSIEISRIADKSFLRVPYLSVYAHPRHLQKGLVFSGRR
jgi:hypothetical protein